MARTLGGTLFFPISNESVVALSHICEASFLVHCLPIHYTRMTTEPEEESAVKYSIGARNACHPRSVEREMSCYLFAVRHTRLAEHSSDALIAIAHFPLCAPTPTTSNCRQPPALPQRQPLTKEERAEAERILALAAATGGGGDGTAAGGGGGASENDDPQQALGGAAAGPELIDPVNFLKEFDAWVDGKYPGDRGSSTKVKVAFRKVRLFALFVA